MSQNDSIVELFMNRKPSEVFPSTPNPPIPASEFIAAGWSFKEDVTYCNLCEAVRASSILYYSLPNNPYQNIFNQQEKSNMDFGLYKPFFSLLDWLRKYINFPDNLIQHPDALYAYFLYPFSFSSSVRSGEFILSSTIGDENDESSYYDCYINSDCFRFKIESLLFTIIKNIPDSILSPVRFKFDPELKIAIDDIDDLKNYLVILKKKLTEHTDTSIVQGVSISDSYNQICLKSQEYAYKKNIDDNLFAEIEEVEKRIDILENDKTYLIADDKLLYDTYTELNALLFAPLMFYDINYLQASTKILEPVFERHKIPVTEENVVWLMKYIKTRDSENIDLFRLSNGLTVLSQSHAPQ